MYRRERYYEPTTGRFTQEDPIGLAGGLNLYGFASGDPVNFSDPFGLCPPADQNPYDCPGKMGAFVMLGQMAPAINRSVGAFAAFSVIGGSIGAAASAVWGGGAAITTLGLRAAPAAGAAAAAAQKVLKGGIPDAEPANLVQQIALNAARSGKVGEEIMRNLGDEPRLAANYGAGEWVKMQYVLRGVGDKAVATVHWFRNLTTGVNEEFKFK